MIKHAEVCQEDLSPTNYQELEPNEVSVQLWLDSESQALLLLYYHLKFNSFKNRYVWLLMIIQYFV